MSHVLFHFWQGRIARKSDGNYVVGQLDWLRARCAKATSHRAYRSLALRVDWPALRSRTSNAHYLNLAQGGHSELGSAAIYKAASAAG